MNSSKNSKEIYLMNINNEILKIYYNRLLIERLKIRYLNLRTTITDYALEYCISDYDKQGLTEAEKECIKNRTHTFLTYYKVFNFNQRENFSKIYISNKSYI
jgi:hypothetical protein